MTKEQSDSMGKREQIKALFLQGYAQKEIVDMGYAKSTVSEVKDDMEEKGEMPPPANERKLVPLKEQPLEAIIENIEFPDVNCRDFKKTARFVLSLVVLGVRMTQELSTIGIQQGKPVIEMAKEMRQSEYQVAQTLAEQVTVNMAEGNRELANALRQQRTGGASPMEQLLVDMLRQPLSHLISRLMGMSLGQAQPAAPMPNQPDQSGQNTMPLQSGHPVSDQHQVTDEEIKEVFHD